jgi:E3 ubiquitin-protein ligase synoviolin
MQILTNICLLITGFVLFWLQRLLYGPLRPIETEQLYEKAWFAVTETCLAMTIFRGELGGWFLVMFVSLLVGKVWGWIGEGRVEFLEQQPPSNPRLFHTRLAASLVLSVLFNAFLLDYCIMTVLERTRPDMMVMFGFEFAVLTILSSSTAARYVISLVEIYVTNQQTKAKIEESRAELRAAREEAIRQHQQSGESGTPPNLPDENEVNEMELDVPGWEEKGRWVFYLDLVTDFLKLTVYLSFFAILFMFYGLPIHILRDVVVTIRSFCRRIVDFLRYRNATRDMNERYPDASVDEVTREEVCIICREGMTSWQQPVDADAPAARPRARIPERLRPKKLPCGHILHFACLRSWLERQQNCPTCRRPVVVPARNRGVAGDGGRGNGGPGLQPNFPDGNQAADGDGAQRDGLPRARVYQFGPFRIGFGAGRGDLFHNIHQQIHQGNVPLQQPAGANQPGARQIGFGFGFGRPPPAAAAAPAAAPGTQPATTSTSNVADIQNQLQQMEQHITQEISNLRVTAEQLHIVRLLQGELQRLRNNQGTVPNSQGLPVQTGPFPQPSTPSVTMRRQFMPDSRAPTLGAGDTRLPEGLTLPQGWTLTPLHSDQQGQSQAATSSAPAPTVTETPAQQTSDSAEPPRTSPATGSGESENKANDPATAPNVGASENIPNWQTQPTGSTPAPRPKSPSLDWTHVTPERPPDGAAGPSASAAEAGDDMQKESNEEEASSSSKGKGRVATVEDAADDGS